MKNRNQVSMIFLVIMLPVVFSGSLNLSNQHLCADEKKVVRTLDFEDALGPVGDREMRKSGSPVLIGHVIFCSPKDEPVYNLGVSYGSHPFKTGDWFMFWTYGDGGTITFPVEVTSVGFDAGANNAVETTATFDIITNGSVQQTITFSKTHTIPVVLNIPTGADKILIKFKGGSTSLFGMDNFTYSFKHPDEK